MPARWRAEVGGVNLWGGRGLETDRYPTQRFFDGSGKGLAMALTERKRKFAESRCWRGFRDVLITSKSGGKAGVASWATRCVTGCCWRLQKFGGDFDQIRRACVTPHQSTTFFMWGWLMGRK